jgi:hypothetical protein
VIKSRRMRWEVHVVGMGERRVVCRVLVGKPDGERDHREGLVTDRSITLRWVFREWDVGI